nr:myb/SANT-like DNA-binding domain-containing protein 3 [Maniola hyperantus]
MAGTGRQFFNENEKICLQELVLKYNLNSMATTMGSAAIKKTAWARLTQEFNAMETNSKRTEAQLKKCWDNLKTRRKSVLAQEKRERMRTGGGSFNPLPSTSSSDPVLEAALDEQTDVELTDVIDSDNIPCSEELQIGHLIFPSTPQDLPVTFESRTQSLNESVAERGSRNIRTKAIEEEFNIRQKNYERSQKREEELHKFRIAEKEWMVKAAEENFFRSKAEREAAEELLHCNRARREEAELALLLFKNKNMKN